MPSSKDPHLQLFLDTFVNPQELDSLIDKISRLEKFLPALKGLQATSDFVSLLSNDSSQPTSLRSLMLAIFKLQLTLRELDR